MNLLQSLKYTPVELSFGTSGLRGLVTDMTDLECYINAAGFLRFLAEAGEIKTGDEVYLAGDLRDSTPRILGAVAKAILDGGYGVEYCGLIPTPALAAYALKRQAAGIMVTGSHIPADRNGIKFYKTDGEILKNDEGAIKQAVAAVRAQQNSAGFSESGFDADGALVQSPALGNVAVAATSEYVERYVSIFEGVLAGKKVVLYQHSAGGTRSVVDFI